MLDKAKLIASFEEIVGWPYKSPGTNDRNGIDCSGAFVRAYRAQGASIYHGSNTIYRQYCSAVGKIASVSDLQPGMALFKNRTDGGEPAKFQGDGLGNFYHIGLVASVNPLRIIHATSPVAKVDTKLFDSKGKPIWHYWGRLAAVAYEGSVSTDTEKKEGEQMVSGDVLYVAVTLADEVRIRAKASVSSTRLFEMPLGARVDVLQNVNAEWARVRYANITGYTQRQYLQDVESVPDAPAGEAGNGGSVSIDKAALKAEMCALIDKYM